MSPTEIVLVVALSAYAVYQQSRVSRVDGGTRFKMALIYGVVGLAVGGIDLPSGTAGYALLAASIVLSVVVGLARGRLTKLWRGPDGEVLRQGTPVTIGLFIAMIVVKFAMGAWASIAHVDDGQGFGAVLIMLAVMVAVQAQIVWRRAQALGAGRPASPASPAAAPQPRTSSPS